MHCDWSSRVLYNSTMHAAYVTSVHYNSTYARKPCQSFLSLKILRRFSQTAIKAEEFPSFDLGFDFLNDQNSEEAGNSPGETASGQKERFADVTEAEKNQLLLEVQVKATKSATNWAVNAFKGKETQSITCM